MQNNPLRGKRGSKNTKKRGILTILGNTTTKSSDYIDCIAYYYEYKNMISLLFSSIIPDFFNISFTQKSTAI